MNTVGGRLRMLRAARGNPPQTHVAQATGLSVRSYNGWEGDRQRPGYDSAALLADYFDTTPEFILYGSDAATDERLERMEKKLDQILKLLKSGR